MIKVDDIAFVRFSVPDLGAMEEFLADFGLVTAHRDANALYSRGGAGDPYLHVAHKGDPAFAALAFEARSLDDLHTLAKAEDTQVQPLDGPGSGSVVRLKDPDGFVVEVVAGRESLPKVALPETDLTNDARTQPRRNQLKRIGRGSAPAHVKRLGHCVLNVSNFRASEAWYKQRFGFITSDEVKVTPEFAVGAFMRCDRGELPTDHHTLFLAGTGTPKFNHAAFEVVDFDDLMSGHHYLKGKARHHEWGVGRHMLGSQVFDYWRDPWGHTLEHWTDGDLLTADWGSREVMFGDGMGNQWGPPMPPTMAG